MTYEIDLLAPCGLFCGICPKYLEDDQKCGGCCSGEGFAKFEHKMCGILKCLEEKNLERCSECEELDECKRLESFCKWDSFISHKICISNCQKHRELGDQGFLEWIKSKIDSGNYPPKAKFKLYALIGLLKHLKF